MSQTGLGSELTSFVGRARALSQIESLLDSFRMVVVLGPGGMGKTRVAKQIVRGSATRIAAVAVVLRFAPRPEVLLIKRAEHPNDPWSGHMAFPGGRQDPRDATSLATALRETQEEVGLDLQRDGQLLGQLDDLHAVARAEKVDMLIVPHVFLLLRPQPMTPQPGEVDAIVWVPLEPLLSNRLKTIVEYKYGDRVIRLPGWQIEEHTVWGLTHRMLQSLFDVLRSAA